MPLLRPRTVTPARLAANRRSARRSTGPRTERGKAWSRLNGLRTGGWSPTYERVLLALYEAPLGRVDQTAAAMLTPQELAHPVYARLVERMRQVHRLIIKSSAEYKTWRRMIFPRRGRPRIAKERAKPKTRL
jgi:hypothetical protein